MNTFRPISTVVAFLILAGAGCLSPSGGSTIFKNANADTKEAMLRARRVIPNRLYEGIRVSPVPANLTEARLSTRTNGTQARLFLFRSDQALARAVGLQVVDQNLISHVLAPNTFLVIDVAPGRFSFPINTIWGFRQLRVLGPGTVAVNPQAHHYIVEPPAAPSPEPDIFEPYENRMGADASGTLDVTIRNNQDYFYSVDLGGMLGNRLKIEEVSAEIGRKQISKATLSDSRCGRQSENEVKAAV